MKHIWGKKKKKMIYLPIFGYTLSSLGELGEKNAQITFNLTDVSDHRSNLQYAIKLKLLSVKIRVSIVLSRNT